MGGFFTGGLKFMGFMKAVPIIIILLVVIVIMGGGGGFDLNKILPDFDSAGKQVRGTVVRVIDGDTIEVKTPDGKEVVRMVGIDTPETVRPGVSVECGGPQASAFMKRVLEGERVKVVTDPTQAERDTYDRLLAYVYPSVGDRTYQEEILRAGWAEVYVFKGDKFQKVERFRKAEMAARNSSKGVWGVCGGDFHSAS